MSTISAKFEKGVFRPGVKVSLPEGTVVSVTVPDASIGSGEKDWPEGYFSRLAGCLADDPLPEASPLGLQNRDAIE